MKGNEGITKRHELHYDRECECTICESQRRTRRHEMKQSCHGKKRCGICLECIQRANTERISRDRRANSEYHQAIEKVARLARLRDSSSVPV